MRKFWLSVLAVYVLIISINKNSTPNNYLYSEQSIPTNATIREIKMQQKTSTPLELSINVQEVCLFTQEEMDLLAHLVYSEAGNQPDDGVRLVCDCILNRIDSDRWPDTITEVIYQKGQFGPVWNGGLEKWGPQTTDRVYNLVAEEVQNRTNYDVIYFNTTPIGNNWFQVGQHYFGI